MAKANNESNFEKLKEKMLQKRDIVERRFEPDPDEPEFALQKKTSENINTNNDSNINSDINSNRNINDDINSDSNTNIDTNRDRVGTVNTSGNVNIDGDINRNISDDRNVSVNRNNNVNNIGNNYGNIDSTPSNAFILKVGKREDAIKRQSYYLKDSTIKRIDDISISSGIGKSELVQRILEEALNNIQIVSI